jgi:hypothetical protein
VIPLSDLEEAEGVAALDGIVSVQEQLRKLGYTEEEVATIMAERKAEQPPAPVVAMPAQPTPATIARTNNVGSP